MLHTHISEKDNTTYILFKANENLSSSESKELHQTVFEKVKSLGLPESAYDRDKIIRRLNRLSKGFTSQVIISNKSNNEYVKIDTKRTAYATIIDYSIYKNIKDSTYILCSNQEHKKETYLMLAKGYEDKITQYLYPDEITNEHQLVFSGRHMLL